jgi:hypothetical protein
MNKYKQEELMKPFQVSGWAVGDHCEAAHEITAGSESVCAEGTPFKVLGLSGNALHPIAVCKRADPYWVIAVSVRDIRPVTSTRNRNRTIVLINTFSTSLPNKPPPGGYSQEFPLGHVIRQSPTARKRSKSIVGATARMNKTYKKTR